LTKSFPVAKPIPSVPPVMTAVLPASFLVIVELLLLDLGCIVLFICTIKGLEKNSMPLFSDLTHQICQGYSCE
jgi:hypothetical protein